jgi:predicted phosphodiesterase
MIYVTGDIHGQFNPLLYILENGDYSGSSVFIAGDVGIGFYGIDIDLENLKSIEKRLKKIDVNLYLVRGNHDNPGYWFYAATPHDFKNLNLPHIHFVRDYQFIKLEGHKIACIGGATSIDRDQRTQGKDWWKDEHVLKYKSLHHADGIDTVISHAAPIFCPPGDNNVKGVSYDILQQSREDREILKQLYFALIQESKITNWFYGHYHKKYETWMSNDITNYSSLDIKLATSFSEPTGEDECRFRGLADLRGTTIDIESL